MAGACVHAGAGTGRPVKMATRARNRWSGTSTAPAAHALQDGATRDGKLCMCGPHPSRWRPMRPVSGDLNACASRGTTNAQNATITAWSSTQQSAVWRYARLRLRPELLRARAQMDKLAGALGMTLSTYESAIATERSSLLSQAR